METMTKKWYAKALSLLLACLMVVTMVPPIHVHAAEASLVITNAEGAETDTFVIGEPIFVTANSSDTSEWIGFYSEGSADGSSYWFWYYVDKADYSANGKTFTWVNGGTYNIYDTVCYAKDYDGDVLEPGRYEIRMENNTSVSKTITLVSPESVESSLSVESTTVTEGDPIKITATSYSDYAWVGVYSGKYEQGTNPSASGATSLYSYMTNGHNGLTMDYTMPVAGDYTVALYEDWNGNNCSNLINVTVEGEVVELLTTDKTKYNFGEPIMVTSQYGKPNWVGLYKQGDKNPTSTGPVSLFWTYAPVGTAFDITNKAVIEQWEGGQQRPEEFTGGTYKVLLLSANYDIIASVENIEINAVPSEPVRTEPTCEKDGKIVISYNDGTSETVTADKDESLKKLGHDYGDWSFDGKDTATGKYTHSQICSNLEATCETHIVTEECSFDEGIVTTPPQIGQNGIKTYTCAVCEGTREEPVSAKQPVGEPEVIEPATCQKVGTLRTYYSEDKTEYIDSDIPMLQHEFGEWKPVEGTKQHIHICTKDGTATGHTETEDCTYGSGTLTNGEWVYTCGTCNGTYSEPALYSDKDVYAYGEPIMVGHKYTGDGAWIGLYKEDEQYDPDNGGSHSIYWYYLRDESNPVNILSMDDKNGRTNDYHAGTYKLVLFGTEMYTPVVATKTITVTHTETNRVTVAPTCEEDGTITIHYNDGLTDVLTKEDDPTLEKLGHAYGNTWTYDGSSEKTHSRVCGNDSRHVETVGCTFDGGVITKPSSANELGEKTYTCSVCEGTYKLPYSDKPIKSEVITKPATCDEEGIKLITFEDNTTMELPIDKLGHDYSDWAYDGDVLKTHTKVCANDATHFITENCAFVFNGTTANGVSYKCDVCGGIFEDGILSSDKDTYELGEPILVTALCDMQGSWVGLYKKGDKYNPDLAGGVVSLYWYYVTKDDEGCARSGQQINLLDFRNNKRVDGLANGSYELVLFGDTGYTNILAKKDIEIYTDMSNTTFDVKVNGQLQSNNAEIAYPIGSQIEMTVSAEGNPGTSWVGVYASKLGANANFVDASSYWAYINEINGQTIVLNDKMDIGPGDYTIVVFENGGYDKPIQFIYFSLNPDTTYSEIIKAPTCTDYGTKLVKYEGSDAPTYVPIAPLGHDVEWTYSYDAINDKHTHSGVCKRAECGELVVKDCAFDEGELIEGTVENGTVKYTCTVCGGSYTETNMAPPPVDTNVYNIAGEDRYATALDTADMLKEKMNVEFFNAIVLASGDNFPDALAGSYLANAKQAPILLINQSTLESVKAYIAANLSADGTVYILGGEKAISAAVEDALSAYNVKRLSGDDRYETNLAILNEAGVEGEDILVCTGENYADSLSASAVGKPVLLVKDTLTAGQKAILNKSSGRIYILGGINAVSKEIEAELRAFGATMRIGGEDRQATSVMIAEVFFNAPETVMVAYSNNYPDGLCAGPLAYCMNAPLILTRSDNAQAAKDYIAGNDIEGGMVLGGEKVFDNQAIRDIFGMDETDSIVGRN